MSAAEKTELFKDLRRLSPGERLAFQMAVKAETKKAKRERRKSGEAAKR